MVAGGQGRKIYIKAGEPVLLGQAYKHTDEMVRDIIQRARLQVVESWADDSQETQLYLLKTGT